MGNIGYAHAFQGLRTENRAIPRSAIEHQLLVTAQLGLVRRARRVGLELKETTRDVHCALQLPRLLQFLALAYVDKYDVRPVKELQSVLAREGLHFPAGFRHQVLRALLLHRYPPGSVPRRPLPERLAGS